MPDQPSKKGLAGLLLTLLLMVAVSSALVSLLPELKRSLPATSRSLAEPERGTLELAILASRNILFEGGPEGLKPKPFVEPFSIEADITLNRVNAAQLPVLIRAGSNRVVKTSMVVGLYRAYVEAGHKFSLEIPGIEIKKGRVARLTINVVKIMIPVEAVEVFDLNGSGFLETFEKIVLKAPAQLTELKLVIGEADALGLLRDEAWILFEDSTSQKKFEALLIVSLKIGISNPDGIFILVEAKPKAPLPVWAKPIAFVVYKAGYSIRGG